MPSIGTTPNKLTHIDPVELYTVEYTDTNGDRHHLMVGRIEGVGFRRWFEVPGTRDSLTRVPPKWLEDLMESARRDISSDKADFDNPSPDGSKVSQI